MSDESTQAPLRIRYTDPDGNQTEKILGDKPITIGRSPDADVITLDERASRMHCSIRLWDGEYYVKDLKSKNGTYLNQQRVEMAKIKPGDKVRLGIEAPADMLILREELEPFEAAGESAAAAG